MKYEYLSDYLSLIHLSVYLSMIYLSLTTKKNFLFLFCSQSKIKHIILFNDFTILLNYVVGWQSRSLLTGLLPYLAKNIALLIQNFSRRIFFGQNPFSAILRFKKRTEKQVLMAKNLQGGVRS